MLIAVNINDFFSSLEETLGSFFPYVILFGFILSLIIIWLVGMFFKFILKRIGHINPDARNIMLLTITILQFLLIFYLIFNTLYLIHVDVTFLVGSTAILATAIGLASTSVAYNVIGGLYIILTRPFGVGDFIKTQDYEGIVEEISLNYTTIVLLDRTVVKVPNNLLVKDSLLNYNIFVNPKTKSYEKPEDPFNLHEFIQSVSLHYEIVKYRMRVEARLDVVIPPISYKNVYERVGRVCEQFAPIFGSKPKYYFGNYEYRQEIIIIIKTSDGYTIFNTWRFFVEALYSNVFKELQVKKLDGTN